MFDIINANKAERKELYRAMQLKGGHTSPSHSRELDSMVDLLGEGEEILAATKCTYFRGLDSGGGTVFLTNKRVVILNKGFLFGVKNYSIRYGSLNSIEFKGGLMMSSISFRDADVKYKVDHLDKAYAKHMNKLLSNLA